MASFAERRGFVESRTVIQHDSLDDETRIALWNLLAVLPSFFESVRVQSTQYVTETEDRTQLGLLDHVWTQAFKRPRDERPYPAEMWQSIKATILKDQWWIALNLIEEIAKYLSRNETQYTRGLAAELVAQFNDSFEQHLLGFRFIGREITPIDSNEEAFAIGAALQDVSGFGGAKHHLARAIALLADRQTPDYPNSIKESISAVEAVVKLVTGEGTL